MFVSMSFSYSNTITNSDKTRTTTPPLLEWEEVRGHPGLVSALTGSTSNPVLLLVKPDCLLIQEQNPLSVKSRVQGTALVVQHSSNEMVIVHAYIDKLF